MMTHRRFVLLGSCWHRCDARGRRRCKTLSVLVLADLTYALALAVDKFFSPFSTKRLVDVLNIPPY